MANLIEKFYELLSTNTVSGLKIEFEAQGATLKEVEFLEKLASDFNLDFSVKISGAEAIRDLNEIKDMKINSIIAPLIESPYALSKFVQSVNKIYENNPPKLEINIESIVGFENLEKIINTNCFHELYGIKIGRNDLASSVGLNREFVNSDNVLLISKEISSKIKPEGLYLTLGGGVSTKTLEFAKKLPYLTHIETRNIIFDYNKVKSDPNAINLALEFEVLLIKNKENLGIKLNAEDLKRIEILESTKKGQH